MTLEQEINDLQRQRDEELHTLRYTASRTKRNFARAMNPDRQVRKHLGLALGAAVVGGFLLAPRPSSDKPRKKRRDRAQQSDKPAKKTGGGIVQTILHYFPQLAQAAPFLAKEPPAEESTGAGEPAAPSMPHAYAEDYGREDEPVKPFSTPHVDDTPVTAEPAAYEGYTSDAEFDATTSPRSDDAAPPPSANGRSHHPGDYTSALNAGNPLKAIAATLLVDLAQRVDWQQIIHGLQQHFMNKLSQTANPPEPPSVAIADAGATPANTAFGNRFSDTQDRPKG